MPSSFSVTLSLAVEAAVTAENCAELVMEAVSKVELEVSVRGEEPSVELAEETRVSLEAIALGRTASVEVEEAVALAESSAGVSVLTVAVTSAVLAEGSAEITVALAVATGIELASLVASVVLAEVRTSVLELEAMTGVDVTETESSVTDAVAIGIETPVADSEDETTAVKLA